jgi:hypothetical protein
MRRTFAPLLVLGLLVGCQCGHDEAPPPSSAAPPSTTTAPPAPPSTEAFAAALAEARAASEAHDYATARQRFDALAADPSATPAVRCEAGWVDHLAGDDTAAATAIDLALAGFDRGAHTPALARELAMCFYNRGQLFEAHDAPLDAYAAYAASVQLRANATVQARLDALHDDPAAHQRVGGVPHDFANDVLHATSDDQVVQALTAGTRIAAFAGHATVTQRAAFDLSGALARRATVYVVHRGDGSDDFAVLSLARPNGYSLLMLPAAFTTDARPSVAGGRLRIDSAATERANWFYDGAFRPDTVCYAETTYDVTLVVTCDDAPDSCIAWRLTRHGHDVSSAPIRCHATADGALVDGAPAAVPSAMDEYVQTIATSGSELVTSVVSGSPSNASTSLYPLRLCADHDWCSAISSWQFDGAASEPSPTAWMPDGMLLDHDGTFVSGTTPPLLLATWQDAFREDGEPTFFDFVGYFAPFRGGWRELVELQAADGDETVTAGALEHVDLMPGDPLELRVPLRWQHGDDAADAVMVCAMIDGALGCRASARPSWGDPISALPTFDGHGHVTVAPDDGGDATEQDLVAWIRAAPPP